MSSPLSIEQLWLQTGFAPNPGQRSAILHKEGPLRIIAGPGSGKTRTLVERFIYLITEHGVAPSSILISTFTEKAAAELITRASDRLADLDIRVNFNELYIGTLHSIALRIVDEFRERTRLRKNYALWDEFDQQYLLYQNLNLFLDIEGFGDLINIESKYGPRSRWTIANELAGWLNKAAEELLRPDVLDVDPAPGVAPLGEALRRYHDLLDEHNALDFTTIQVEAWRLLTEHPDVLATMRERIEYLMIDEYQDTNTIQEEIVLLLAGERANICIVGDDDQSLYRFRGATVRNILEFPSRFPEEACASVTLDINYRSHPGIVDFYNRWIDGEEWGGGDGVTYRVPKRIVPRDDTFVPHPSVCAIKGYKDEEEWHAAVLDALNALRIEGNVTDWNQIAFLFSSVRSEMATNLADYLDRHGIPVYAPRSGMFFEREEVMLMMGGLLALFPQAQDLLRVNWKGENEPPLWAYYERALALFVERLEADPDPALMSFLRENALKHFPLTKQTNYVFSDLFYRLLGFRLFGAFLGDSALGDVRESRPARNLARLSNLLNRFEYLHNVTLLRPAYVDTDLNRLFGLYFRYLYDGGIDEFEDGTDVTPSGCLSFMTIHQSKGLEFPVVVVASLYDRARKSHTGLDEHLQERHYRKRPFEPFDRIAAFDFRRKYYTAFSRPKNLLVLTGPERGGSWPVPGKAFRPYYTELPEWSAVAPVLPDIPIEPVGQARLKNVYAFTSHITLFENCARQYKFFRELEFMPVRSSNILFGTLVHQTIEDVHRAALAGNESAITTEQVDTWFNTNYRNLSARFRQYLSRGGLIAALRHVMTYVESRRNGWSDVREAEVDVSLVKDDYILTGTVDLIRGEGNTVEIVDFKSDAKPDVNDPEDRIRLERYRRQLEVYGHIVAERYGHEVSRLHLFYTGENVGNPYISWPNDLMRLDATVSGIDSVVRMIEGKEFEVAERPERLCKNCDMQWHCDGIEQ